MEQKPFTQDEYVASAHRIDAHDDVNMTKAALEDIQRQYQRQEITEETYLKLRSILLRTHGS